jgi:hypothetical protein
MWVFDPRQGIPYFSLEEFVHRLTREKLGDLKQGAMSDQVSEEVSHVPM